MMSQNCYDMNKHIIKLKKGSVFQKEPHHHKIMNEYVAYFLRAQR